MSVISVIIIHQCDGCANLLTFADNHAFSNWYLGYELDYCDKCKVLSFFENNMIADRPTRDALLNKTLEKINEINN